MSFKPYKMDFVKGKEEYMKNKIFSWGKKGNGGNLWETKRGKMKVSFEVEGREKWLLQQSFLNEISRISEFEIETTVKIELMA